MSVCAAVDLCTALGYVDSLNLLLFTASAVLSVNTFSVCVVVTFIPCSSDAFRVLIRCVDSCAHFVGFCRGCASCVRSLCVGRGVDPHGTGGHVPPIFGLGGHYHECPPQYF